MKKRERRAPLIITLVLIVEHLQTRYIVAIILGPLQMERLSSGLVALSSRPRSVVPSGNPHWLEAAQRYLRFLDSESQDRRGSSENTRWETMGLTCNRVREARMPPEDCCVGSPNLPSRNLHGGSSL